MTSRAEAVSGIIDKTSRGNKNFSCVDKTKAERLGVSKYMIKDGDNFIRIMDPNKGEGFYGYELWQHGNIGVDQETVLCLKTLGMECPICKARDRMLAKDPNDPKAAALKASRRFIFLVYDVKDNKTEAEGLKWLDAPQKLCNGIVSLTRDRRTKEIMDISSPTDGCDVEFTKTGKGKQGTDYFGFKVNKVSPVPEEWTQNLPDFLDILDIPSTDDIEKKLSSISEWIGATTSASRREEPQKAAGTVREESTGGSDTTRVTRTRSAPDGSDGSKPVVQEESKPVESPKTEKPADVPATQEKAKSRQEIIKEKLEAAKAKARGQA
jgi:hypothetical protein